MMYPNRPQSDLGAVADGAALHANKRFHSIIHVWGDLNANVKLARATTTKDT